MNCMSRGMGGLGGGRYFPRGTLVVPFGYSKDELYEIVGHNKSFDLYILEDSQGNREALPTSLVHDNYVKVS